eukprot:2635744-Rhodomonas_salina.2
MGGGRWLRTAHRVARRQIAEPLRARSTAQWAVLGSAREAELCEAVPGCAVLEAAVLGGAVLCSVRSVALTADAARAEEEAGAGADQAALRQGRRRRRDGRGRGVDCRRDRGGHTPVLGGEEVRAAAESLELCACESWQRFL